MPTISIIVPVYKVEQYLSKCIDSILAQTFTDFELILVDDGSPDRCGEMCDEYVQKDSRIRVIHKENGGLSSARNAGLDVAYGKYIGFVDSDDYIESDMYEFLYKNLTETDSDIAICGIFECYKNVIQKRLDTINGVFTGMDAFKFALSRRGVTCSAWNKLYKKEIFDKIRYPVGKIYEDMFVIGDIMLKAKKVSIASNIQKYFYVQRQGSITQGCFSSDKFQRIEVSQYHLELIRNNCPQALPYGVYGLVVAYRVVLDFFAATSVQDRAKYKREIAQIGKSMRGYIWELLFSPIAGFKTKIAGLLVAISPYLYMYIMKYRIAMINRRHEIFDLEEE